MTVAPLDITVEAESVMAVLRSLDSALSPEGMAAFLGAEVGPYLAMRAKRRFEDEGDEASGKWAPLLPATVAIRAANPDWPVGGEHPINKRTGEMEAWVTGGSFMAMPHALGATLRYPGRAPSGELARKVETAQKGRGRAVPRPVLAVDQADLLFVVTRLAFKFARGAQRV